MSATLGKYVSARDIQKRACISVLILSPGYFDILILSNANNSSVVLGMEEEEKSNTESFLSPIR